MTYSRAEITRRVRERLGPEASDEMITSVVERVMELLPQQESELPTVPPPESPTRGPERIRITAHGAGPQGMLTAIREVLAEHHSQVRETSQTVDQDGVTVEVMMEGLPEEVSLSEIQKALETAIQALSISVSTEKQEEIPPADE